MKQNEGFQSRPSGGRVAPTGRARWAAWFGGLSLLALVACGDGPARVIILSPLPGTFTNAASVDVQGVLIDVNLEAVADVQVNGLSAMPLAPGGVFNLTVPLDAIGLEQPITVEVIGESGGILRDRVMMIAGDSVAEGDLSYEGIALRLSDAGLAEIEPLVTSLIPLDIASLVPAGTLVIHNYCYSNTWFGCLGRVNSTVSGSPAPSLSGFNVAMDSMTDFVAGDVTLYDLYLKVDVVAVTGIGFTCHIDINAATTLILGDYALSPLASNPEKVDVAQVGGVAVQFGNFSDSTNCDGFLGFIVEAFIGLVISDLKNDFVKPGLEDFLNTPDVAGNTPVAGSIESALEAVEIAGPIGTAFGVDLQAPLFTVIEDINGITLGSDARVITTMPDPTAPDLTASYDITLAFPNFGTTAPNGLIYELAVAISPSTFNQLLRAEVESGLLVSTITEFDLGFGPQPITGQLLALLLPPFAALHPAQLLQFDIRPTMAPIFSGEPGPAGELATVHLPQLELVLAPVSDPSTVLLAGSIDVTVGVEASYGLEGLVFTVTPPSAENLTVTLLENPLYVDPATLDTLLPALVGLAVPVIADSLGSFSLPQFLGLELSAVDIARQGGYTVLFFDLSPVPVP
ncbi:MAG: hypothetical protein OSB70_17595 [Myxococcota bacterium]|nr:hypothetical protein [Myxococcota bacterium]